MKFSYINLYYSLRITIFDTEVKPSKQAHGESSSIFQLIDQLEVIADELTTG
jgi:hypothetical protein